MEDLKAVPKRSKGRPRKNFDTTRQFEWLDESAYKRALQDFKLWEQEYERVKVITDTEFETIEEFEADLRTKYPDLEALDITQLYLVAKLDKQAIRNDYRDLKMHSKVPVDKETYTVKVPAENALEYSHHLAIVQSVTELRKTNNQINMMAIPQIFNNKIVFDIRSGQLRVNDYLFAKDYN